MPSTTTLFHRFRKRLFALGLFAGALYAPAVPVPSLDSRELIAQSDILVLGHITSRRISGATSVSTPGGTFAADEVAITVEVDRWLTLPSQATIVVTLLKPKEFLGYADVPSDEPRIFFLRKEGSRLVPVSNYYPTAPGNESKDALSKDRMEAVTKLLITALRSDRSAEAIRFLETLQSEATTTALLRLTETDPEPAVRCSAAAALLRTNHLAALNFAERVFLDNTPALQEYQRHNLAYAIMHGIKDQRAIPSLARLQRSSDLTRRAAAFALRETHSAEAVPLLSSSLRDKDFEVRYFVKLKCDSDRSFFHKLTKV
jgi:hypothetical protein